MGGGYDTRNDHRIWYMACPELLFLTESVTEFLSQHYRRIVSISTVRCFIMVNQTWGLEWTYKIIITILPDNRRYFGCWKPCQIIERREGWGWPHLLPVQFLLFHLLEFSPGIQHSEEFKATYPTPWNYLHFLHLGYCNTCEINPQHLGALLRIFEAS